MTTSTTARQKKTDYWEGVGRRKTAVARVRITPASKASCLVNGTDIATYFKNVHHQKTVLEAVNASPLAQKCSLTVKVLGGGASAQAEAIRLGSARALVKHDASYRPAMKSAGFLKRDSREVERKKFGLRKARKRPQWSKR